MVQNWQSKRRGCGCYRTHQVPVSTCDYEIQIKSTAIHLTDQILCRCIRTICSVPRPQRDQQTSLPMGPGLAVCHTGQSAAQFTARPAASDENGFCSSSETEKTLKVKTPHLDQFSPFPPKTKKTPRLDPDTWCGSVELASRQLSRSTPVPVNTVEKKNMCAGCATFSYN